MMTIEYARNVLGLAGANSSEFDPPRPHPVIDLMDDPARRHRHGRHDAPRRLRRPARRGLAGRRGLRHHGRVRAPPPPLRVQPPLPGPLRGQRALVLGHLARRPAGRVHRAPRTTRSGSAPRPTPSSRAGPTGRRRCSGSSSAPRWRAPRAAPRTCSTSTRPPTRSVECLTGRAPGSPGSTRSSWPAGTGSGWCGPASAPRTARSSSATSCAIPAPSAWCRCTTTAP